MTDIVQQFCLGPIGSYILIGMLFGGMFVAAHKLLLGDVGRERPYPYLGVFIIHTLAWPFTALLFVYIWITWKKGDK